MMGGAAKDRITALDVFGNTHDVRVADLSWRPAVYGIVIEDGKLLMPKQFKTKYNLPGGGVNLGEDLEAALIREVKEETGIDVEVLRLAGFKTSIFYAEHDHGDKRAYHSLLFYFLCKKVGGKLSMEGFDEQEQRYAEMPEWVSLGRLDDLEMTGTVDCKDVIRSCL